MPLGLDRHRHEFNLGDSAELEAYVLEGDDIPVNPAEIVSVVFDIEKPDSTTDSGTGQVQGNGAGFYRYLGTDQVGPYRVKATFTFTSGKVHTDYFTFSIIDPFNPPVLSKTERIVQGAWRGFEDLFDSELGGPWLRDMTKAYFNEDKITEFMNEAMLLINSYPPATNLTILDFTGEVVNPEAPDEKIADPDESILTRALRVVIIRHLIRSYVEQPDLKGAQAVIDDRRDYLQRWQSVLQIEEQQFMQVLALWKRQFYGFYQRKILIGSKAGRLMGPGMRQRNAGRGFY